MYWVSQNPPPAHIFLISGDSDFAGILHKLRMNNYNILLASSVEGEKTPCVLRSAASIMWRWNELAKGENISGRHFNQPPDGPFNSWYGHYRGPLEDPYEVAGQNLVADNSSKAEVSSESNYHPIPVAILRQLRRIVDAYPKGLSITEFRVELDKMKVPIDKNYYGHKKFSRFLMSVPHIVKVEARLDGYFCLRPVTPKVRGSTKGNDNPVGSKSEKRNQEVEVIRKENGQASTITRMEVADLQLPVSPYIDCIERTLEEMAENVTPENKTSDVAQKDNQATSTDAEAVKIAQKDNQAASTDAEAVKIAVAPKEEQSVLGKVGLLKRLWVGTSADTKETSITSQHGDQGPAHSSTVLVKDAKSNISDKPETSVGFITRVISWWNSWRNSSVKTSTEISRQDPDFKEIDSQMLDDALHSKKHELFCKDTFWRALQSFLKTRRGADIVSNSTSREQFAERLQMEGPVVLRPLQESDLHQLIDLLVSEKKWIKEFPTQTPRFRMFHPLVECAEEHQPQNVQPHRSNGLSSIFKSSSSEEYPKNKVSSALRKKPSENSRSDVLADCQKLLDELLSQNPKGFNMGLFKEYFHRRYGYNLDHHKLGYPKLASLIQIMPGVKVHGPLIIPGNKVYSSGIASLGLSEQSSCPDNDVSDSPRKNEDGESPWEELGPVAKQERKFSLGNGNYENGNYEPSVSDDELSEWEEDTVKAEEDQRRSRMDEEDSSLLQILDSWYSTKEESEPQDQEESKPQDQEERQSQDHDTHAKGLVDCSKEESEPPQTPDTSVQGKVAAVSASAFSHARKQSSGKSYIFVSDPVETKKDKLIDGILGSLKKTGEPKMQE